MRKKGFLGILLSLIAISSAIAQDIQRLNITFESAGYTMHGELIMPQKQDSVPMIVFLLGAGANSSYRTLYKSFVEENLEALFLREGYGILYFDKRGVGDSEGKWHKTDIYERADDAKAAVDFLKTVKAVDTSRIGLVGHSQGGWVAQVAGALYPNDIKMTVSLASPVFSTQMSLTNIYYSEYICEGDDKEKAFENATKKARSDLNWVDWFPLKKAWRHLKEIAEFDPSNELKNLTVPSFFVFADNDNMVYPGWAINSLNELFPNGIPDNYTLQIIPGANHDFKTAPMCATNDEVNTAPYSQYFQQVLKSWVTSHL